LAGFDLGSEPASNPSQIGAQPVATIFKPKYTKPIPADAEIITRDGKPHARFKNPRGKTVTLPLTEDGTKVLIENRKWYIEYRDGNGKLHRVPGFSDRKDNGPQNWNENPQGKRWG
jgi:hypothetical protein